MDGDGARGRDGRGEDIPRAGDGARPLGSGCRTGAPVAAQEKRAPLSLRSSVQHMVCLWDDAPVSTLFLALGGCDKPPG